jgi:hypothetical protein
VEDFDVFTRSISIGPQTLLMRFDPSAHGHYRYVVDRDFLAPELEWEVETISRLVNAFFGWEFNACETIVTDGQAHPIDYANASPDIALVSLHYYFPWAIEALVAWCIFCMVTGRAMRINQSTGDYFEIADRDDLGYESLAFSSQPRRHSCRERCLSRSPLRLRRRRMKRLERADVRGCDFQGHLAWIDRADLLTRDVPDLSGLPRLDGQAVEDVGLLIPLDLRDLADDDAIGGDDVPALLDLQPRDRISH